jgi:chromosome segregation ATPase
VAEEVAPAGEAEAEALEQAITDGRELQGQVGALFAGAQRRIEELRAEAAQVRRILERDLVEARLRVLEFADTETKALAGTAEAALADARRELEDLRERLTAAEHDRHQLLDGLKAQRERTRDQERRNERLKREIGSLALDCVRSAAARWTSQVGIWKIPGGKVERER